MMSFYRLFLYLAVIFLGTLGSRVAVAQSDQLWNEVNPIGFDRKSASDTQWINLATGLVRLRTELSRKPTDSEISHFVEAFGSEDPFDAFVVSVYSGGLMYPSRYGPIRTGIDNLQGIPERTCKMLVERPELVTRYVQFYLWANHSMMNGMSGCPINGRFEHVTMPDLEKRINDVSTSIERNNAFKFMDEDTRADFWWVFQQFVILAFMTESESTIRQLNEALVEPQALAAIFESWRASFEKRKLWLVSRADSLGFRFSPVDRFGLALGRSLYFFNRKKWGDSLGSVSDYLFSFNCYGIRHRPKLPFPDWTITSPELLWRFFDQ